MGMGWHKKNQYWQAQIRLAGKNKELGKFRVEAAAARAHAVALGGDWADMVNFPLPSS